MGKRASMQRVTRSQTRQVPENRYEERIDSETEESEESEEEIEEPVVRKRSVFPKKTVKFEKEPRKSKEKDTLVERPARKVELPYREVPEVLPAPVITPAEHVKTPIPVVEKESAYKNVSRVEEGKSVKGVVNKVLNTPLIMTVGDILAMSKGTRDELKKSLTRRKVPVENRALTLIEEMSEPEIRYWEAYMQGNEINDIVSVDDLPKVVDSFMVSTGSKGIEAGAMVVSDPVVQFLESLSPGQPAPVIIAAKESQALKAVWPVINDVR